MRTLLVAALLMCPLSVCAEDLPPAPLPMSIEEIGQLPREEGAWEYKWKSHHEFLVVRIISRADSASTQGFSVVEIRHQTADFSEFALVLPGQEPSVDSRVLTIRMKLKTSDGEGPFFTFVRNPDP